MGEVIAKVVDLTAAGLSAEEIAERLKIALCTVYSYRHRAKNYQSFLANQRRATARRRRKQGIRSKEETRARWPAVDPEIIARAGPVAQHVLRAADGQRTSHDISALVGCSRSYVRAMMYRYTKKKPRLIKGNWR